MPSPPQEKEPSPVWCGFRSVLDARLPPVLERLSALLGGEHYDLSRIEELASLDPVLACQLVRHSQEPPAASGDPPVTLWDAAVRLGAPAIRQVCRSSGPESGWVWSDLGPRSASLLEHSLATAAAARGLARELMPDREQEAYLAGLIHDIGMYAMLIRHGNDYLDFIVHMLPDKPLKTSERDQFGLTHEECGLQLAEEWNLPEVFRQVISRHHAPPDDSTPKMVQVIALAEKLATAAGLTFGAAVCHESEIHQDLRQLGLPKHTTERLLPAIYEQLRRTAKVLGTTYRGPGDLCQPLSVRAPTMPAPADPSLRRARELLRSIDTLQTETELATWLRDTVLQQTAFERTFLFLLREDEAAYREALTTEETRSRRPQQVEAQDVEKLGFGQRSFGYLRLRTTGSTGGTILQELSSEDLMLVPLQAGGRVPPVGLLCCDRRYSGQAHNLVDLNLTEVLARAVGQEIELRRMADRLETYKDDAERDYLTGIYNRRTTIRLLERELLRSRRTEEPLCLIMLDIDNFKTFNDIYGHLAGDTVLREVARLLYENARTSDVVGRYGGEEFLIVLPNTTIEAAYVFAERLRAVVENYGRSKLTQYPDNPPTISIGVSWVVPGKDTADDGIERVDRALYGSKKGGRNRVCLEPAEFPAAPSAEVPAEVKAEVGADSNAEDPT